MAQRRHAHARARQECQDLAFTAADQVGHHVGPRRGAAAHKHGDLGVAQPGALRQRVLGDHHVLLDPATVHVDLIPQFHSLLLQRDLRLARRPAAQLRDRVHLVPEADDDLDLALRLDRRPGRRVLRQDAPGVQRFVVALRRLLQDQSLLLQESGGVLGGQPRKVGNRDVLP